MIVIIFASPSADLETIHATSVYNKPDTPLPKHANGPYSSVPTNTASSSGTKSLAWLRLGGGALVRRVTQQRTTR